MIKWSNSKRITKIGQNGMYFTLRITVLCVPTMYNVYSLIIDIQLVSTIKISVIYEYVGRGGMIIFSFRRVTPQSITTFTYVGTH